MANEPATIPPDLTYNPNKALTEAPLEPDVPSVQFTKGPQPGYRQPIEQLWDRLVRDVKALSGSRFAHAYSRLPKDRIRLLNLRPGAFDDPLSLDLVSIPFKKPYNDIKTYEALSYEWGDGHAVNQVILRDFSVGVKERYRDAKNRLRFILFRAIGTKVLIRKNLFSALRHMRSKDRAIQIWVDALCINQPNTKEKTEQIQKMAEIYNRAANVRIWLGGASANSDAAMKFVKDIIEFDKLKGILRREESLAQWGALIELMRSRWFSRRWVIQEIALARNASVYCGTEKVAWDDFRTAISIFMDKLPFIREKFQHSDKVTLQPEGLNAIQASGARALVRAYSDLLHKDFEGNILSRRKTLIDLVSDLTAFESGDPRDTIYALLAIARKSSHSQIGPSYDKSLLQVYTEFIKYCVDTSGELDMICRHWAPSNTTVVIELPKQGKRQFESNLPSWISLLSNSAYGVPGKIFTGRKNADSLVCTPRIYNASGRRQAQDYHFGTKPPEIVQQIENNQALVLRETYNGTLTVRGLLLGKVTELSPRMIPGIIPQEVVSLGGWSYSLRDESLHVKEVPDRLWRTLVANKNLNGHQPEGEYKACCLYSLRREDESGDIRMSDLISDPNCEGSVSNFLKRVQRVVWNRKAFTGGENNELFGLSPRRTQHGDLICILYGCSVPVILRSLTEKPRLGLDPHANNLKSITTTLPSIDADVVPQEEEVSTGMLQMDHMPPEQAENPWIEGDPSTHNHFNNSSHVPIVQEASIEQCIAHTEGGENNQISSNRDTKPDSEHGKIYYEIIGECYVDGYMDGEAIDNEKYQENEFEFTLV
jgi:hypothetical protein